MAGYETTESAGYGGIGDQSPGAAYEGTVAAYADSVEDERSIDELITIAEELPERFGLAERVGQVRGTARGEGVSVSVDTHGMLVELELADRALGLGPERLAAEISRLAAEAATNALQDALQVIKYGSNPRLAAMLGDYLGIRNEPAPRPPEPFPAAAIDSRDQDEEDEESEHGFLVRAMEPERTPAAPVSATVPPAETAEPPRRAARRTSSDEDDDFGGGILVRAT
jgi:hypothetical protein